MISDEARTRLNSWYDLPPHTSPNIFDSSQLDQAYRGVERAAPETEEDVSGAARDEEQGFQLDPSLNLTTAHPLSLAFYAVLSEAASLHDKKQRDYGSDEDPFANVRASEDFGIPGWLGCIIRGNDKMRRLQTYAMKGELANESVEDALIDLLVYVGIALVLFREETNS